MDKKACWNMEKPKLICTDWRKYIRHCTELYIRESHTRCMRLWHVCIPMQTVPEKNWRQIATDQLDLRLRCKFSNDTGYFGFYNSLIGGNVKNILKLHMDISSQQNKWNNTKQKFVMIMAKSSLICYIMYYFHLPYAIYYFSLLR